MRANWATRVVVMAALAMLTGVCEPLPGLGAEAAKTDWLSQARWGVMTHYLGAPPSSAGGAELTAEMWSAQVDAFDVDGLAEQLASTGAKYLLFTIGQNSGHYCAPNATYDVPIQRNGLIPQAFVDQLRAIGQAMK